MLNDVLYYGYNPACDRSGLSSDIIQAVSEEQHTATEAELIETGHDALREAIDAEVQRVGTDSVHVVPLSSGLDSRSILGYLLSHPELESEQIRTVSFGSPGTWDYEIGQRVAAKAGVDNIAIDLTAKSFDWSVDKLYAYAQTRNCPVPMFEGYVNSTAANQFGRETVVWSGFLGETTAGDHQPADPATDWGTAKEWFVKKNRVTDFFADSQFDPTTSLPSEPYLDQNTMYYEEQLDFAHRQQCFIAPVVLPHPKRYATPFAQPEWLSFSMNLSHQHRRDRNLFVDMVAQCFPDLFSLPTDANNGLPLNASPVRERVRSIQKQLRKKAVRTLPGTYTSPNTNYIDFDHTFRQDGQLAATAETLINAFDERDIAHQIDGRELWERHQSGQNLAREIRIVCSLELFYGSQ